jgi:tetratricopeptide (TPR) repeat protein
VKSTSVLLAFVLAAASLFAQQPSASSAAPKAAPKPKTQQEATDYSTAAKTAGGTAMEAAADGFAAKYPESELRGNLYLRAMHEYQTENQPSKMLAMAEKVLQLDPENTVALVLTATVLSDQLPDFRPSSHTDDVLQAKPDPTIPEIKKNAGLALQTVDTSFAAPPGASPEQVAAYKNMLKAMAHSALGLTDLKTGDDAGAETELKAAADLNKAQPDPYTWYQLSLAQEHLKKYPDALASANEGLKYAGSDANLTNLLTQERDKVTKLTGASQPAK